MRVVPAVSAKDQRHHVALQGGGEIVRPNQNEVLLPRNGERLRRTLLGRCVSHQGTGRRSESLLKRSGGRLRFLDCVGCARTQLCGQLGLFVFCLFVLFVLFDWVIAARDLGGNGDRKQEHESPVAHQYPSLFAISSFMISRVPPPIG